MLTLYKRKANSDHYGVDPSSPANRERQALLSALRLLQARSQSTACALLSRNLFEIRRSTDWECDTYVLYARSPLETYEELRAFADNADGRECFRDILQTLEELGVFCTYVALDLMLESIAPPNDPDYARRLTEKEINKLVWQYIGVEGGYLADFSYRTHAVFYVDLDLEKDPSQYQGTTRERFMSILAESNAQEQATILTAILDRFAVDSKPFRTLERAKEIRAWIARLQTSGGVPMPQPAATSRAVEGALADAAALIQARGAASGVDRIHTAFHGYLLRICETARIDSRPDAGLTELFSLLRDRHPAFKPSGPRAEDVRRVMRSIATIADALNPLRNKASAAHPNPEMLEAPEAMLAINAVRTLLHYVDSKLAVAEEASDSIAAK